MRASVFRWAGGVASLLTLAACAGGNGSAGPDAKASAPASQASCNAEGAQSLIGQPFNSDTLARVRAATGANEVRQLKPDSAVTKEYKVGRVNLVVDSNQRVVRVYCG